MKNRHLKVFNEQLFPDRLSFLKKVPFSQHSDYLFTYNLCMKNSQGKPLHMLQRNVFMQADEKGNPLLSAGLVINIDNYHRGNPVIQTVEKFDKDFSGTPEVVFKKAYYFDEEDRLFSKREKEILCWMAEGLTSKEIAEKLFISENTVINHRKNMLHKTNTPNVAALVAFALRHGII